MVLSVSCLLNLICREGSVISDVTILYEALDDQQLVVLYEDLDQDGLLHQDMPVIYNRSEIVVTEGIYILFCGVSRKKVTHLTRS